MQNQQRDSTFSIVGESKDSISSSPQVFVETIPSTAQVLRGRLYSSGVSGNEFPDWYFLAVILVLAGIAWARIIYGKFLNLVWISAYSYQIAAKTQKEQSVVQKRFGLSLDLLYLVNSSLFLYLLNYFFALGFLPEDGFWFLIVSFTFLLFLIIFRIIIMRTIGNIFERKELFKGFLYHFFIYNKVIGLIIIPFLIAIPYTHGLLQEWLVYTGVSIIIIIYVFRLFRAAVYVFKNVVLFFYLILYLCSLEILPLLVVIKVLLSLAQV